MSKDDFDEARSKALSLFEYGQVTFYRQMTVGTKSYAGVKLSHFNLILCFWGDAETCFSLEIR